jgi:S-adenosylmethionine uptake transporter
MAQRASEAFTITIAASDVAPPRRVENGKGVLLMGVGMFLFAAVDTGGKFLTEELHPVQIVWVRQLGLLFGAFVLIAMHGRTIFRTTHPRLQIARGCVAAGSASFFIMAVAHVPLADAVAITFVAPFMVTLLGALILREPVGVRRWIAVILGFVGTLIVIRPGLGVVHPAAILLILAAFLFAVRQIISRALSDTDNTATTIVYTALVASAILTVPLPFFWKTPSTDQMMVLAFIAVVAGVAEVFVIKAFEIGLAVAITPVHYTMLIWGTFYGWLVFDQLPDGWTLLGAAIIVATGLYTLRREYVVSRAHQRSGSSV